MAIPLSFSHQLRRIHSTSARRVPAFRWFLNFAFAGYSFQHSERVIFMLFWIRLCTCSQVINQITNFSALISSNLLYIEVFSFFFLSSLISTFRGLGTEIRLVTGLLTRRSPTDIIGLCHSSAQRTLRALAPATRHWSPSSLASHRRICSRI